MITKYWSGYAGAPDVEQPDGADAADRLKVVTQSKQTNQAHFAIGFRSYGRGDDRNYALNVLSAVLSGGMSGRLFNEVREKRGLAYYVDASADSYHDTGSFVVRAGVEIGKISTALEVVIKELQKIRKTLLSPNELRKGKEYLKGRVALQLEGTNSKLSWYLEQVAFSKKVEEPTTWMKKIDKVTPQDVKKVAQELIQSANSTLAVIGPYSDKDKKSFGEIVEGL